MSKFTIYQVLPRLFGNYQQNNQFGGSLQQNGCGKFNSFSDQALGEIKSLGITHVWFTGIIKHATKTDYTAYGIKRDNPFVIKGMAGSPYAISDYYDVDPDLAEDVIDRMQEFQQLVERTHKNGLQVIIDFVPNHVARNYKSAAKPQGVADLGENDNTNNTFNKNNNFYYIPGQKFSPQFDAGDYQEFPAKVTGNDHFSASPGVNDWYETVKLNYGVDYHGGMSKNFEPVPDTWIKMRDILLYWAEKQIDGFRCDMAEMVPVEFWEWAIDEVKQRFPDIIFIAEVYNPQAYRDYIFRGGFDYLYDKVGLYDLLRNIVCHNHSASSITHAWQSLDGIADRMLNFLENHDEQRIASDFFAGNALLAKPAMIVSALLTKAPVMIYSGQELGEKGMDQEGFSGKDGRTTIFDYWCVDTLFRWANSGEFNNSKLTADEIELRNFYKKILNLTVNEKAFTHGVMYDLQYANHTNPDYNTHRQFSFFRKFEVEIILVVVNFDSVDITIQLSIPQEALDYLGIKDAVNQKVVDLLDINYQSDIQLRSDKPLEIIVPANGGRVLKVNG
jgi:glycosidase